MTLSVSYVFFFMFVFEQDLSVTHSSEYTQLLHLRGATPIIVLLPLSLNHSLFIIHSVVRCRIFYVMLYNRKPFTDKVLANYQKGGIEVEINLPFFEFVGKCCPVYLICLKSGIYKMISAICDERLLSVATIACQQAQNCYFPFPQRTVFSGQ